MYKQQKEGDEYDDDDEDDDNNKNDILVKIKYIVKIKRCDKKFIQKRENMVDESNERSRSVGSISNKQRNILNYMGVWVFNFISFRFHNFHVLKAYITYDFKQFYFEIINLLFL